MSDEFQGEPINTRWLTRAVRLLLLPFLILDFAPSAYSQARPSVFLEDLTWTELRDEIGAGKTTIIVPVMTTVIGTHAIQGNASAGLPGAAGGRKAGSFTASTRVAPTQKTTRQSATTPIRRHRGCDQAPLRDPASASA